MSWIEILTTLCSVVLGGGWILNIMTIKSQKRKVAAEADSVEIDNAEKVIKLMEGMMDRKAIADQDKQEALMKKISDLEQTVTNLNKDVTKLTRAVNSAKKCPVENCPVLKKLNDE